MLLHSGHITALYSRHDSDIHPLHTDVLSSSRIEGKQVSSIVHSALCTRFAAFPTCMVAEPVFLELGH